MELVQVKLYLEDADFWLINKHQAKKLGFPNYDGHGMGIKVNDPTRLDSRYLYYLCLYLYQSQVWHDRAVGSIPLKYLRVRDVRQVINAIACR